MTSFDRLWAKSRPVGTGTEPQFLCVHSLLADDAAAALLGRAAGRLLTFVGLDPSWTERLAVAVRRAAIAHDLGKANDHFQLLVRRQLEGCQGHRHEHLTLWLLSPRGPLGEWFLGDCDDVVRTAVLAAVVGHHFKLARLDDLRWADCCPARSLTLLLDHDDIRRLLDEAQRRYGLPSLPPLASVCLSDDDRLDVECQETILEMSDVLGKNPDSAERRFTALVRSLLLAADLLSSTGLAVGRDLAQAVAAVERCCSAAHLDGVVAKRLRGYTLRPFQQEVAASDADVTVVAAGCGTGKTLAAYAWGAEWARRLPRGCKLFFCYPTMGTATEGYLGYLADDPSSRLLHSHAAVDLALVLNGDEDDQTRATEVAEASAALALWEPSVVACTVDTILGWVQNHRAPAAAIAALAHGVFVFDEVHQYDDRLFAGLCRFLATVRAPALVMSASLQQHRREALAAAVTGAGRRLAEVPGPADLESLPRYTITTASEEEAVAAVAAMVEQGGKVLWVSNTVDRTVARATQLRGRGLTPLVYHSRFRYVDRAQRHRQVVEAFRGSGPVVAVTTQVCEVSLDISADLLVTDLAPIPALVQRLGRLNRHPDGRAVAPCSALVIHPPTDDPYDPAEQGDWRAAANSWLQRLAGAPRSQHDLAAAADAVALAPPPSARVEAALLDGLPWATVAPVRAATASLRVLLASDAAVVRRCPRRQQSAETLLREIPMPLPRLPYRTWEVLGTAFVAPEGTIDYSADDGARWKVSA